MKFIFFSILLTTMALAADKIVDQKVMNHVYSNDLNIPGELQFKLNLSRLYLYEDYLKIKDKGSEKEKLELLTRHSNVENAIFEEHMKKSNDVNSFSPIELKIREALFDYKDNFDHTPDERLKITALRDKLYRPVFFADNKLNDKEKEKLLAEYQQGLSKILKKSTSDFCTPNFDQTECVTPDGKVYRLDSSTNQLGRGIKKIEQQKGAQDLNRSENITK